MKALSTAFFALILSTSFAVADGCGATTAKTQRCNVKQVKLGMTSWAYAWTQAHKLLLIGNAKESNINNKKCR